MLIFGIPLIGIVFVLVILVVLAVFGSRIYQLDLNIIYGRAFKKLEDLLTDMEHLNNVVLKKNKEYL